MAVVVDETKCAGCGSCVILCPVGALDISPSFAAVVDGGKCTGCLICLNCCPNEALGDA